VWGSNTEGQLGLGEEGEENVFQPVLLPFNNKVMDIDCGYYHTAIVTDQGELFTFGEVDGGKLGLNGVRDETDSPRWVSPLICPVFGQIEKFQ
jgi:X-linked retinitis pigmentosa GTPase regulator